MSDSDTSDDAMVDFDETNGLAGNTDGESDGTAEGEDYSDADRGAAADDQDDYMAETVQQEEGGDPGEVAPETGSGEFRTGD